MAWFLTYLTDPNTVAAFTAAIIAFVYLSLLMVLLRHEALQGKMKLWLIGVTTASLLSVLSHALLTPAVNENLTFPGNLTQPALGVYLLAVAMLSFSRLSLRFLRFRIPLILTLLDVGWLALLLYAGFNAEQLTLGATGWARDALRTSNRPALVAVGGWAVLFAFHMVMTVRAYVKAHLPELANRMLFWALIVPLFFLGVAMGASDSRLWAGMGWVVQLVSVMGAAYGVASYRVFDIRNVARQAIRFSMIALVTASLILALLLIAQLWPDAPAFVELGLLALGAALLFVPLRRMTEWLADRLMGRVLVDPTQALRRYSREIVGQIDLDQLVAHLVDTLIAVLNVKRGALILAREQDGAFSLELLSPERDNMTGLLASDSPIYQTLREDRSILLQYDLEYRSRFDKADSQERAFFAGLKMNAYASIIVDGELIGIVASGPKASEVPFYVQELELLATIASQTGVALRNARLVADLRASEAQMIALNASLNAANARLARLDNVKSDFITIASHELRTPLAQLRGYTDIIQAFNEQGILDKHTVNDMAAKLRKATARLEVLISDMLDVSQLDVDAMDLRFVETKAENIMRMAIEPLADAIKDRKLTLGAYGLRDLPPVKADLERLVQAFRNIVVNAIKYTPDGGSIEIVGRVHSTDEAGEPAEIQIAIADTGVGIDPEHLELIFEKFFRGADPSLHSTGATKFMGAGPGLGLTIARGVIEGHGGRIWCESEGFDLENFPGSTFYIILPVMPPEDASRVLPFEKTDAATPSPVP